MSTDQTVIILERRVGQNIDRQIHIFPVFDSALSFYKEKITDSNTKVSLLGATIINH